MFSVIYFSVFAALHTLFHLILPWFLVICFPSIHAFKSCLELEVLELRNYRRLLRSMLYCSIAFVMGPVLWALSFRKYPKDTLTAWSEPLNVCFHFCLCHWLFSIVEDFMAGDAVLHALRAAQSPESYEVIYKISLFSHHVLASMVYLWSIQTEFLSLQGVIGIFFEVPVLLLSARELYSSLTIIQEEFAWLVGESFVKWYWRTFFFLWHVCRTTLCGLYPISLIWWMHYLHTIPHSSMVAYHVFSVVFLIGNFRVYTEVLMPSYRHDLASCSIDLLEASSEAKHSLKDDSSTETLTV